MLSVTVGSAISAGIVVGGVVELLAVATLDRGYQQLRRCQNTSFKQCNGLNTNDNSCPTC